MVRRSEEGSHEGAVPRRGFSLSPEVEQVFTEFRTCEFSTLARDGTPITWPLITLWQPEEQRFVLTTSIDLPNKAFNARREGRVSLLFSDPTASGLQDPPAVLVQGDAEVPEEIHTSPNDLREYWKRTWSIQPGGKTYGSNFLTRSPMDWYYMRLYIYVRPRRILVWPDGDFAKPPMEVDYVDEIEKYLPLFESAVLNASDGEGYPYSVRCRPEPDRPAGILRIDFAGGTNVQAGPASLLYHSHDEELWNQKIFLLRGRLEERGHGHVFRPEKFVPSIGTGGPLGTVRMVLGVREATAAYLKKRNLERPRIPWAEIAALKEKT